MTIKRIFLVPFLAAVLFALAPAGASAAEPAPAWDLSLSSQPTNFEPGGAAAGAFPGYLLTATNVGGESTSGVVTLSATLPAGVTPGNVQLREPDGPGGSCVTTTSNVTCTTSEPVSSGRRFTIFISVEVAALPTGSTVIAQAQITGGGAPTTNTEATTSIASSPPTFDFLSGPAGLRASAIASDGAPASQAGSHPYQLTVDLGFPSRPFPPTAVGSAGGGLRDLAATLPRGLIVDPTATPRCTEQAFEEEQCPDASVIGTVAVTTFTTNVVEPVLSPLYNLVPPAGAPAEFGFNAIGIGIFVHLVGGVRSDGDYSLYATTNDIVARAPNPIVGVQAQFWGQPSDLSHDSVRGGCAFRGVACPVPSLGTPLLTLPTSCAGSPTVEAEADSWEEPGVFHRRTAPLGDLEGNPTTIDGCNALGFEPSISARPTTDLADSPSGLEVDLHQPQAPVVEARDGQQIVCSSGAWSNPAPTSFSYHWLRNAVPISGATERRYVVGAEDAGSVLQCEVAAENGAAGPDYAVSRPTVVAPAPAVSPPTPTKPVVSVKLEESKVNFEFTCEPGSWTGASRFEYSWYENGTLIAGANKALLKVPAEVGGEENKVNLQCRVLGSNEGGTVAAITTNARTAPVSPEFTEALSPPEAFLPEGTVPLSTAALKGATVTLPQGVAVNPSQADGLAACSESQIGYLPEKAGVHFSKTPNSCPDASKLGTAEVTTPLIAETGEGGTKTLRDPATGQVIPRPLHGAVYLATPLANPFGSLVAIYLAIEDPQTGTIAKLAGKASLDQATGQITTSFEENPQLPIEDVKLDLYGGPRGALITPPTCGLHTTTTDLVPWSTPEGADAHPESSFQTSAEPGGGSCPGSESAAANAPGFTAGTLTPQAGAYSPFVLKISREDGSQRLTGIDTTLAPGLLGKLAGVAECSDAQIAAAQARSHPEEGRLEQRSPSCPASSEVGSVTVGAGAGPTPFYAGGHAYLAGPYKGAPLSLAIITPAVAGPFDLGTVVTRVALHVEPETAVIHAVSDPLPTILDGIPLDIRSVALRMDRPDFTLNPTSCDPLSITGTATSSLGALAPLSTPFQVGGCDQLGFKPKLQISLKGQTGRAGHPALKAVLTYPKQGVYANIARAQVNLPHSEFIDQGNLNKTCTRPVLLAGNCPKSSIYGKATAWTPLLDKPLEGPVYLVGGYGYKLPALVAELDGQIRVLLKGKVDTGPNKGIRNTFEAVPDAPVEKFVLEMKGGPKYSLLENSENLCKKPQRAIARFTAQDGKVLNFKPRLKVSCPKPHKKHHHKKKRHTHHGGQGKHGSKGRRGGK